MAYKTRKGTTVLHPAASTLALIAEIYWDAAEYEVYSRIAVGDWHSSRSFRFYAEPNDRLLVHHCKDIPTMCHVLNLTFGDKALIPWDALAHSAKPADEREV